MIEYTTTTGDTGVLIVDDYTDGDSKLGRGVDLFVQSTSPVSIPELSWSYTIDDVDSSVKSFNFKNTTLKQHLGFVYVGYAGSFVLHLGVSGHAQLAGPTDLPVTLNQQGGISPVRIKHDGKWVTAIPYIKVTVGVDAGTWQPATAYVVVNGDWVPVT